jgi:hypothetical protein
MAAQITREFFNIISGTPSGESAGAEMENGNGLSVVPVPNYAEVDATVKDVADLQSQIQQLLGLQREARV